MSSRQCRTADHVNSQIMITVLAMPKLMRKTDDKVLRSVPGVHCQAALPTCGLGPSPISRFNKGTRIFFAKRQVLQRESSGGSKRENTSLLSPTESLESFSKISKLRNNTRHAPAAACGNYRN